MIDESQFVTGWCPPEDECPDGYWCLSDGTPPGYWDPSDGCPPGCNETPEFPILMPQIGSVEYFSIGSSNESFASEDYVLFWYLSNTMYIFGENGFTRSVSPVPVNDPALGTGTWSIKGAVVIGEVLYTLHNIDSPFDPPHYENIYIVEQDIRTGVIYREQFLYGGVTGTTTSSLEFINVPKVYLTGDIMVLNTSSRQAVSGVNSYRAGLVLINTVDFSFARAGRSSSSIYSFHGIAWVGDFNFFSVYANSAVSGTKYVHKSIGEVDNSPIVMDYSAYTSSEVTTITRIDNFHMAIGYPDCLLITDFDGVVLYHITEGYSNVSINFDSNNVGKIITVYGDKLIVSSNFASYKSTASVGVADVFSLDTFNYLYTLDIPGNNVVTGTYYGICHVTQYGVFRRRISNTIASNLMVTWFE